MSSAEPPPTALAAAAVTERNLANYDSDWSAEVYSREARLRPLEDDLVRAHFPPPPARVLDLGCGAGRTTIDLAQRGYEMVAIDLADRLLDEALRHAPELDFRHMDATDLAFPDASFDAVFFSYNGIDCIYPVAARERCIAEAYRVLKPGGRFLLSSHNLLGALFSGGYFYPRGYLNALKILWRQRGNALTREWYLRYDDGGGVQHLYSAPPNRTVLQLEAAGFELTELCGFERGLPAGVVRRRSQHVHFVARKPAGGPSCGT
jgi:SAM-dependent methyltransferase